MNRTAICAGFGFLFLVGLGVPGEQAQQPVAAEPQAPSMVQTPRELVPALPVPRLVKFAGTLKDEQGKPRTGVVGVTFAVYKEQEGGAALWLETQNVELDEQGRYTVLLGSTKSEGLPLELFSSGEPRWLGVQVNLPREVEQPRVLLVSVPYALKAADADTLGGKPASVFLTTDQLAGGTPISGGTPVGTLSTSLAVAPLAVSGTGSTNFLAKWLDNLGTLGNSQLFDNGTNVGIGTSSPARSLHIRSAAPTIRLEDTNVANSFWELQQSAFVLDTFGFLRYENGSSVADKSFVVSSAGNIGFGATNPQRKLHIRSAAPVIRLEDTNLPNSFWELQQSAFVLDTFGFLRYENGVAVPSKSFVMSSGGNFGIGTGTPTQKLEVSGNIKISGAGNALTFPDGTVMSSAATGVGGGTITGVTAGTGLTGGGAAGGVTLGINPSVVPQLGATTNTFTGNITAGSFTGSGAGLSNVNATMLGGMLPGAFATTGANTFTGNQTIAGNVNVIMGTLALPNTTSATAGVITLGGVPFLHDFGPPSAFNTFIGVGAGNFSMTGANNAAVGTFALSSNTTGNFNAAFGTSALTNNTTGFSNSAFGTSALQSTTTACCNSAFGSGALQFNMSGSNSAFGYSALNANTTGSQNSAFGDSALLLNTTGFRNAAFGTSTLRFNTTGTNNDAFGVDALFSNNTGFNNSAFGDGTLAANTTGANNSAFGASALNANTTGFDNSAFGFFALQMNTTGLHNSAFGENALLFNTVGQFNSAFGFHALQNLTSGDSDIAIGSTAGLSLTTGSSNIYIGADSGASSESNIIRVGSTQTAAFMAGISGATSASGVAVFVNTSGQLGTVTSSRRFKEEIADLGSESDLLMKLRPVSFYYKPELDNTHTRQYGLVAEEVAQVAPHLVVFDKNGAPQTVRYHFVNAMLLNEVQKQRQLVEEQSMTIARQQVAIQDLEARLAKLEMLLAPKP